MASSKMTLLVMSGVAGMVVHALAPAAVQHGARPLVWLAIDGVSSNHGRARSHAVHGRGTHGRCDNGYDFRLSYRRHLAGEGAEDSTAFSFDVTTMTSLPLDSEQIRSLGESNSRAQRAGEITASEGLLMEDEEPSDTRELDGREPAPTKGSNARQTKLSSESESRSMVREITALALPSLGGLLLDPIMSIIDTACVGQVSTTALAAMAPCTSIFQFAFFAFFFLSAATTNLVASSPPENARDTHEAARRVDFNQRVVSNAAGLAVVLGSIVTMALVQFSDPLLRLAGIPPMNTALLNAARPYLMIRAIGMPFTFLATVLQGASLGRGNAWRPLRIFGAAGIVNLVGDVWLTLIKGWGATGAATATVIAQIGASLYYVISATRLDKSVKASSQSQRDVALVWRGLPSKRIVKTFTDVATSLFSRSISMMLTYSMMTRTAALGGETALAAHQVALQVWWLLSFLPEPMAVAAQILITRDMKDRKFRVPQLIKTLYGMSGVLGMAAGTMLAAVLGNPTLAGLLVADLSVQKIMAGLVPFAVLSQSICPLASLSDGICIGLGAFSHLPIIMAGGFLTTAATLAFVSGRNIGVPGVWACMNVFVATRLAGHLLMSSKLRQYIKRAFPREKYTKEEAFVPKAA